MTPSFFRTSVYRIKAFVLKLGGRRKFFPTLIRYKNMYKCDRHLSVYSEFRSSLSFFYTEFNISRYFPPSSKSPEQTLFFQILISLYLYIQFRINLCQNVDQRSDKVRSSTKSPILPEATNLSTCLILMILKT